MLRAAPGAAVEAYLGPFATGLAGTVGVRIRDGQGADTAARTTAGIVEDIAGSGLYRKTLTAPAVAGVYWVVADNGSGLFAPAIQLVVTSSVADVGAPSGRDLCTLTDVLLLAPGYALGDEPIVENTLQVLLSEQSRDFLDYTERELSPRHVGETTRRFEIGHWERHERELLVDDAATITAIELLEQDGTLLQTVDSAAWWLWPWNRDDWEPVTMLQFPRHATTPADLRPGTVASITGQWGFPAIPLEVTMAVARLTVYRYLVDATNAGTKFASAATLNGNVASGASLANAMAVRERYRRFKTA